MMRLRVIALVLAACAPDRLGPAAPCACDAPHAPQAGDVDGGDQDPVPVTHVFDAPESVDDAVIYSLTASNPDPALCCAVAFGDTSRLLIGTSEGPPGFGPVVHRALVRLVTIPEGELLAWRLVLDQASALAAGTIDVYRVSDANVWAEPEASEAMLPQAGRADYFSRAHPVQWSGGPGLAAPGVDYDADDSPPSLAYAPGEGRREIDLPVEWPRQWRTGERVNNGVFLRTRSNFGSDRHLFVASAPVVIEVDVAP